MTSNPALQQAMNAIRRLQFDEAITLLSQLLARQYCGSAQDLQVARGKNPDVAVGLNNLAEIHYAAGHYSRARKLYERALIIAQERGFLELYPLDGLRLHQDSVLTASFHN